MSRAELSLFPPQAALSVPKGRVAAGLKHYIEHARDGVPLREIARREGIHPSTVLRQVRGVEKLRDDPLIDAALHKIETTKRPLEPTVAREESPMSLRHQPTSMVQAVALRQEACRVLRRLAEQGAVLAIAQDLEKAMVVRTDAEGRQIRSATLDRATAESFALQDWISCTRPGRVASYTITAAGRAALRRFLAEDSGGFEEASQPFAAQHRVWGEKTVTEAAGEEPKRLRYNMAESPVVALGRRRDKDGVPYLTPEQVAAGERLREDFELAHMGARVAQNWDRFLTGRSRGSFSAGLGAMGGPQGARDRVALALRELGPGLGDMALRCCCHLEGLEAAERRLGWAARSGKVVLRIALDRLRIHYEETYGAQSRMIG